MWYDFKFINNECKDSFFFLTERLYYSYTVVIRLLYIVPAADRNSRIPIHLLARRAFISIEMNVPRAPQPLAGVGA